MKPAPPSLPLPLSFLGRFGGGAILFYLLLTSFFTDTALKADNPNGITYFCLLGGFIVAFFLTLAEIQEKSRHEKLDKRSPSIWKGTLQS